MSDTTIVLFAERNEDVAGVFLYWGGPDTPARLEKFFTAELEDMSRDNRFSDPEYLAARFVVWASDTRGNSVGVVDVTRREETNVRVHCDSDQRPRIEVLSS